MYSLIEIAYKEALKSTVKNKYGAVLIYKNKIISSGHNYLLTVKNKKSSILCS